MVALRYVYVDICVFMLGRVYARGVFVCDFTHVFACVCALVQASVSIFVCVCVCVCVCVYTCMHVCVTFCKSCNLALSKLKINNCR